MTKPAAMSLRLSTRLTMTPTVMDEIMALSPRGATARPADVAS
jgi:hypothetical protein